MLSFICCYLLNDGNKCGEPAPEYYYQSFSAIKTLCNKHAQEYISYGLEIKKWSDGIPSIK